MVYNHWMRQPEVTTHVVLTQLRMNKTNSEMVYLLHRFTP
jgi:hypothetical protein